MSKALSLGTARYSGDVLRLLEADRLIGVTLTEAHQLIPEHSTAAIVVQHPEASYFAVRQ